MATKAIDLGATIQAADVTTNDIAITDFPPNGIKLTSLVVGQIARQPVVSGQAITTDVLAGASGSIQNIQVPVGHVAMAVQVDQVTGVGTIIKAGDYVDIVNGITGTDKVPLVVSPTIRPGGGGGNATPAPRGGFAPEVLPYNSTTVKTLIQGVQVLGTLLPPPTSNSNGNAQASPGAGAETTLNGQQQIVVLSVTSQDVEVIKFAQIDGNISLVLRSTDDCQPLESPSPSPSASPSASPGPSLAPLSPCPVIPDDRRHPSQAGRRLRSPAPAGGRGHPADPVPAVRSVSTPPPRVRDPLLRPDGPVHRRPIAVRSI